MQYPYEQNFDSFEDEVRHRLEMIEKRLTDISMCHNVMQEMVRSQLHTLQTTSPGLMMDATSTSATQRKPYFNISLVKNEEGDPMSFRVSGRTYDIKDQLKSYGNAVFHKETKSWEFMYNQEVYQSILEYLRTLTDEINVV
jgi:hypothetical protein